MVKILPSNFWTLDLETKLQSCSSVKRYIFVGQKLSTELWDNVPIKFLDPGFRNLFICEKIYFRGTKTFNRIMGQWNTLLNCIPCAFFFSPKVRKFALFFSTLCIYKKLYTFKIMTKITVFYHITSTGEIEFQKPTLSQKKMHIPLRSWL